MLTIILILADDLGYSDPGESSVFEYHGTAPLSRPERWLKDTVPGDFRLVRPWEQLTEE